jgi:hypothetical protein
VTRAAKVIRKGRLSENEIKRLPIEVNILKKLVPKSIHSPCDLSKFVFPFRIIQTF